MTDRHARSHDEPHAHTHGATACCDPEASAPPAAAFGAGRAYKVNGLDCAEEVAVLKQAIGSLVGGADRLAFDVLNSRMTVADDARDVTEEVIVKAVAATGMSAVPWATHGADIKSDDHRRQQILFTSASGACVLIGLILHVVLAGGFAQAWKLFGTHAGQPTPWPEIVAYLAAVVFGGRFIIVKAWYAVRNLRADMHLLMTVAVLGAMVIGEWFEAATVTFLFALSLALESWSVGRARRAISALLDLAPPTARVLRPDGSEAAVPVAEVRPGDRFIVPAGERIPLDGRVAEGRRRLPARASRWRSSPVRKSLPARSTAMAH